MEALTVMDCFLSSVLVVGPPMTESPTTEESTTETPTTEESTTQAPQGNINNSLNIISGIQYRLNYASYFSLLPVLIQFRALFCL